VVDRTLLTVLGVVGLALGCFSPELAFCPTCEGAARCPEGARCTDGVCRFPDNRCTIPPVAERGPAPSSDAAVSIASCASTCCIGARCLPLPASVKPGLVLWLDGSHLPGLAPDDPLTRWPDRSALELEALPLSPAAPPSVRATRWPQGLAAVELERQEQLLVVEHHVLHDVGSEDFVLLVALSMRTPGTFNCLFGKAETRSPRGGFYVMTLADGRPQVRVLLDGDACRADSGGAGECGQLSVAADVLPDIAPDRFQLFVIRRLHGTHLELRLNRSVLATARLPETLSLGSGAPLRIGGCSGNSSGVRGSVAAVVLLRSSVSDADLGELEATFADVLDAAHGPLTPAAPGP
jgi:hypothetical protein